MDTAVAAASEVELSLLGNRDVSEVREVLERVVATRVDFLADCPCGIGHDPQRARQFAINAYSLSLGTEALWPESPDAENSDLRRPWTCAATLVCADDG